jgi:hypothetical protein
MTRLRLLAPFALYTSFAFGAPDFRAPHEVIPGTGAKVHYVHLHGESEVKLFGNRDQIIARIRECRKLLADGGGPVKPMRDEDIPKEIAPVDTHVYSGSSRSVATSHIITYAYSPAECGLIKGEGITTVINTRAGQCKLDSRNKTAVGACDLNRETSVAGTPPASVRKPTGTKNVAGHACELYMFDTPIKANACVSTGGSFIAFPSHFNPFSVNGLVLWSDTTFGKYEAVEVKFDMEVSPRLFEIPNGYKVISRTSAKGPQ